MEPVPRTQVHTSDLSPNDFGILSGKIVSRLGLAGPFLLSEGTIDDYVNQSQKPELVWLGGTEADPYCIWISFPSGGYMKLKWPTPSEAGFCQSALNCIISDLEQGGGTRERYLIPELTGPDWSIVEVLYGDDDDAQFSLIEGSSLIDLMGELNGAETLPDDWLFSIDGGVLVLSVPHGTNVTAIELGSGLVVEYEGPSFDGAPPSSLTGPLTEALAGPLDDVIQQYEELLTTYTGLLGESVEGHAGTTEAAIQTAYSSYTKVNVRWTDADGDPRISYKDPVNGWYHPVEKAINSTVAYTYAPSNASTVSGTTIDQTIDLSSYGVPANARFAHLKLIITMGNVSASSGSTEIVAGGLEGLKTGFVHDFYMTHTHTELVARERLQCENLKVRVKAGEQIRLTFTAYKAANHFVTVAVEVVGWSR